MRANIFFVEVIFIFFVLLIFSNATSDHCNKNNLNKPSSFKVKELILCDYDKTIRPVLQEEPLIISTHLYVQNIDVFEWKNRIKIKGWGIMKWRDEHIHWEPEDNNNVSVIFLNAKDVWTPDLVVFPARNSRLFLDRYTCAAFYDKMVVCLLPINIKALCKADFSYWPFDSHNCTISIESFFHRGDQIDFNDTETNVHISGAYQTSWDVIDYDIKNYPGAYKCCPNMSYPSLKLNFLIKRRFSTNIVFVLLPIIILALTTILAIWLNPRSSDRIYIAAVNTFFHTHYLLDSAWELPTHTDCVPYLILLIRNSQVLATILLIETIVVRYFLNKCGDSPRWLTCFFSSFTKSTFGQIFLYPELYSNNSMKNTNVDDGETLVEEAREIKEWNLLGIFLDRFIFFLLIIIYVIMFIVCIPK